MVMAFIAGSVFAGIGILLSMAVNNWQISLIFSGTVAIISIVLSSILSNVSLILKRKALFRNEDSANLEQGYKFARIITVLGIPNIITAVAVYLLMFR